MSHTPGSLTGTRDVEGGGPASTQEISIPGITSVSYRKGSTLTLARIYGILFCPDLDPMSAFGQLSLSFHDDPLCVRLVLLSHLLV